MECKEDHLLEAAKALLLLGSTPPPDRPPASTTHLFQPHPLLPAVMPVASMENVLSVFLPQWGLQQRRSRYTVKRKRKQIEVAPFSVAAAAAASCSHRSPDTPLDLEAGSDPSTSGSDGFPGSSEIPPFKRFRAGETSAPEYDARTKVIEVERSPSVEAVRPSQSQAIKRQGRKKTKSELQAEEIFLLEDKQRLMKMLEFEIIGREAMLAENRKLLSELASSQRTPAEAEPAKLKYLVPDLNEPALERLEPDCDDN